MTTEKHDPWALLRKAQKTLSAFLQEGSDERDGAWFRCSIESFCDHIDRAFEDRDHAQQQGAKPIFES
jgi:hypothetical protein